MLYSISTTIYIKDTTSEICKDNTETEENNTNDKEHGSTNKPHKKIRCKCARKQAGEEMVPAGTLLHLVPVQKTDNPKMIDVMEDTIGLKNYIMRKVDDVADFGEIKICPNMVKDHMPPEYVKSLRNIKHNWESKQFPEEI